MRKFLEGGLVLREVANENVAGLSEKSGAEKEAGEVLGVEVHAINSLVVGTEEFGNLGQSMSTIVASEDSKHAGAPWGMADSEGRYGYRDQRL